MKRIFRWLETISSRPKEHDADDQPSKADPDNNELDLPKHIQDFLADAPMPDIYTDECAATVPRLKALDLDLTEGDESPGIDPYDTGILQKK